MHPVLDVDFLGDWDLAGLATGLQSYDGVIRRDIDKRRDFAPGHLWPDIIALLKFPSIHEYVEALFLFFFRIHRCFTLLGHAG